MGELNADLDALTPGQRRDLANTLLREMWSAALEDSRGGREFRVDRSSACNPAFADAVARRVVDLLREEGVVPLEGPRLMTVAQVRDEFGVSADWLYANADAIGVIRLGSGPRARLRFDRTTIAERIAKLASDRRRTRPAGGHRKRGRTGEDGRLLPILDTPA